MPSRFAVASLTMLALVSPALAGDMEVCEARNDKSIAACTRIIKRGPESADMANVYYKRGLNYRDESKYDDAIKDFTRAIRLKPDWVWPLVARGHTYAWSKKYDLAIADQEAAVKIEPSGITYSGRGAVLMEAGELDRALADLSKAVELDPKRFYGYRNRANLYMKMARFKDALADYDKAIEIGTQKDSGIFDNEIEECRKGVKKAQAKIGN